MKKVKFFFIAFALICISLNVVNAAESIVKVKKTAESILALAGSYSELNQENAAVLKAEIQSLSVRERVRLANIAIKQAKEAQKSNDPKVLAGAKPGLYVLAVFLPPIAVGIHTEWGKPTLFNVLWCCLGYLPGVIHAFIVLGR